MLLSIKIDRLYLRVSTDEQDLTRHTGIEDSTRSAGYYIAGVYREKASGARADRPELLCCATIKVRTRDNQDEKVLPGLG